MKAPLPWHQLRVSMGALGLEARGGRPQGRGCLLLAVAAATALGTLVLAVPTTVLAVLALAPQEQRGQVPETADPGAQSQPRLGSQEPPEEEEEVETDGPGLPAAHLIGAWTKGQGLGWEARNEEAFLRSGARFSGPEGLALPRAGLYYLYCHVGYRGRAAPAGARRPALTLRSALYRAGGAYGPGAPELLLEGAETVAPAAGRPGAHEPGPLWYTSVGFGGLVQLRGGERVFVNVSTPDLVDYRRGKTFFGAVMVG
ncbi:lymphotoxin-beta [Dasypus novemcinctus]|uniref:Lymphotoxin-beta n=1 Tax=Dasypus novemcinctus TaxID=9361 RepID=A0A0U5EMC9_DASNO|nr:lymphotoxin-beta [Dasypus novemcinctus]CTQ86267.1 TPA: tumor necrosis factor ligand 1C [Dasypus novemcinctus]